MLWEHAQLLNSKESENGVYKGLRIVQRQWEAKVNQADDADRHV